MKQTIPQIRHYTEEELAFFYVYAKLMQQPEATVLDFAAYVKRKQEREHKLATYEK